MMNTEDIGGVKALLSSPKKIAIIPHKNPDGDAMGSTLGLSHYLTLKGHTTTVITPNEFPDFLAWMPGSGSVKVFEKDRENTIRTLQEAEIVFTLDFNHFGRTGDQMEEVLRKLDTTFVMIDHHQNPDTYAKFTFSDTGYGSTCEMVYHFIAGLGDKNIINLDIATCLYTGIVTDSGSFRYP